MCAKQSADLQVEQLEDLILQSITPAQIPSELLGDTLVRQWNTEHAELDSAKTGVITITANVEHLTAEVLGDKTAVQTAQADVTSDEQILQQAKSKEALLQQTATSLLGKENSLKAEQTAAPQQIGLLQKQVSSFQYQLQQLASSRKTLETSLLPLEQTMISLQKDLSSAMTKLQKTPSNKNLQKNVTEIKADLTSTQSKITTIQKQIDGIKVSEQKMTADMNAATAEITRLQKRVTALPGEITAVHAQWVATQNELLGMKTTIEGLQREVDQSRLALNAVFAELTQDENLLSIGKQDLQLAQALVLKEAADVDVIDKTLEQMIADFTEWSLQTKALAMAQEKPADVRQAKILEATVMAATSVEVTQSGDWVTLRTRNFNGSQTFTLGSVVFTPPAGDQILTIPLWVIPEEMRMEMPQVRDRINRQMQWNSLPAAAVSSADIFAPSVLGKWTVETTGPDGKSVSVDTNAFTSNVGGIAGLNGLTPYGAQGKELPPPTPRFTITRINDDQQMHLDFANMPDGYYMELEAGLLRWDGYWNVQQSTYQIAAGSFSTDVNTWRGSNMVTYRWNLRQTGTNKYISSGEFDINTPTSNVFQQIPSSLTGVKDLPWTVAVNETDAAKAISSPPNGTKTLSPGSMLVHPTAGKDVNLAFSPAAPGRMMIYGQIIDLDSRTGDGVTIALSRRSADGTLNEQWRKTLPNGNSINLEAVMRRDELNFDMGCGESLVLSVISGANDFGDSIEVDVKMALRPDCNPADCEFPLGTIATGLTQRLGTDVIEKLNIFDRGPGVVTLSSPSADIARFVTRGEYDTMSAESQSSYRSAIDTAKAGVWNMYVSIVQEEFQYLLLKHNGVVMPASTAAFNDGHHNTYLAQIPNLPSREEVRRIIDAHFEELYVSVYGRLVTDSTTVLNRLALDTAHAQAADQALHDALGTKGLLSAQTKPPSERTLSEQLGLDSIFIAQTGSPDRAGWTVADQQHLQAMIAAESTRTASGGVSTDSTISGVKIESLVTPNSPLALGKLATYNDTISVRMGVGQTTSITFTLTEAAFLNTGITSSLTGMNLTLKNGTTTQWQTTHGADSGISMSGRLDPGTYTLVMTAGQTGRNFDNLHFDHPEITANALPFSINLNLSKPSASSIQGVISREGSPEVFAINMRIVSFDPSGRKIDRDPVTGNLLTIDPKKNTWIVIHGREDSDSSIAINYLAESIYGSVSADSQVITINWNEAASDNRLGLEGANWISTTGSWISNQIRSLGIDPRKVNIVAPSWGSFVGYEVGKNLGGINSIVALDSALNPSFANQYDSSKVNFSSISQNSWAIHSSTFGSDTRAQTAKFAIDMQDSPLFPLPMSIATLAKDLMDANYFEHTGSVYFMSSILQKIADGNATALDSRFSISNLLGGTGPNGSAITGNYDGTLWVKYEYRSVNGKDVMMPIIVDNNFDGLQPIASGSSSASSSPSR